MIQCSGTKTRLLGLARPKPVEVQPQASKHLGAGQASGGIRRCYGTAEGGLRGKIHLD